MNFLQTTELNLHQAEMFLKGANIEKSSFQQWLKDTDTIPNCHTRQVDLYDINFVSIDKQSKSYSNRKYYVVQMSNDHSQVRVWWF